jgi:hypothetical protein
MPDDERSGAAMELRHLAQVAHECGVRLFRDQDGRWLCTSASNERLVHYVTALSCDCRGFARRQRCPHQARLLEHLGWLPPLDERAVLTLIPCTSCTAGRVEEWVSGHVSGARPCGVCAGTRSVPPIAA